MDQLLFILKCLMWVFEGMAFCISVYYIFAIGVFIKDAIVNREPDTIRFGCLMMFVFLLIAILVNLVLISWAM